MVYFIDVYHLEKRHVTFWLKNNVLDKKLSQLHSYIQVHSAELPCCFLKHIIVLEFYLHLFETRF